MTIESTESTPKNAKRQQPVENQLKEY